MAQEKLVPHYIDADGLPDAFPTHAHDAEFWESLGRTVATFGFLEEVLGRAIFAFTTTRPYSESEIEEAYSKWRQTLERTLADPLGNLIETYGKAVREHSGATIKPEELTNLLAELGKARENRNILCHGSWDKPNSSGASVPFFVHPKKGVYDGSFDRELLDQVQRAVAGLARAVMNTVTQMGWQFPGSSGPGKAIRLQAAV